MYNNYIMLLYGIRYNNETIINKDLLSKETIFPIIIKNDVIYLTNSPKQTFEKNIEQLDQLITFLNENSTTVYSREHIVSKCIEKIEENYNVRENEFSSYLKALSRDRTCWKTKFFVIRDNLLLYFKNDTIQNPDGIITLEDSKIEISTEYDDCFEIINSRKHYRLRQLENNNIISINIWVEKIQAAAALTIESKYELKEVLGQGSFAKVKRAIEKSSGNSVAIKIIDKDIMAENRKNITTEITILNSISHPNIVKLHHTFENKRRIYLILDFIAGGDLFDMIVEREHLSEFESSRIMCKIVQAVEYLHSKNICHRDLKPENILFNIKGDINTVCITDFGLSNMSTNITSKLQTACGTPSYVAPEILSGNGYSFKIDIWSCGIILYILLCGFPPFYADNDADLYKLIQAGKYSFPSPYWDNISDIAKDLIRKILVVDPTKRLTPIQILLHTFITKHLMVSKNKK